jgi:hypothetical protein
MNLQIGIGRGFAMSLFATTLIASAANAAMVSFSTVFTNNTAADKVFDVSNFLTLSHSLGNTGGSGSLAIVVSDIRGGGAYLKGVGSSPVFSTFVQSTKVGELASTNSFAPFAVMAGTFGQMSYSDNFAREYFGAVANVNDVLQTQLKFILSAGDQAVVSGTFVVVSAVPAPGAFALICIAGGVGLRGRRRMNY